MCGMYSMSPASAAWTRPVSGCRRTSTGSGMGVGCFSTLWESKLSSVQWRLPLYSAQIEPSAEVATEVTSLRESTTSAPGGGGVQKGEGSATNLPSVGITPGVLSPTRYMPAHITMLGCQPYTIRYRLHISSLCVLPTLVTPVASLESKSQVALSRSPGQMMEDVRGAKAWGSCGSRPPSSSMPEWSQVSRLRYTLRPSLCVCTLMANVMRGWWPW
mmetsp:Transcript_2082/g.4717  ORF Transcript_2082/g.4717 Transcript_2082/m.4717 type:complete len:216 (-) Transcript_2082:733-1380(-)